MSRVSAQRIALGGSVAATVLWAAKAVAIGLAGGLDKSPAEGPLFLLGLVSALVGSGALGVHLTSRHARAPQVLGAIAAAVALILVALVAGSIVTLVQPEDPGWVWGEINLWASALLLLVVVVAIASRSTRSDTAAARNTVSRNSGSAGASR